MTKAKPKELIMVWGSPETSREVLAGWTSDRALMERAEALVGDHEAAWMLRWAEKLPEEFGEPIEEIEAWGGPGVHYLGHRTWAVRVRAWTRWRGMDPDGRDFVVRHTRTVGNRVLRERIARDNRQVNLSLAYLLRREPEPVQPVPATSPLVQATSIAVEVAEPENAPWASTFAPGFHTSTQGPSSHWPRLAADE